MIRNIEGTRAYNGYGKEVDSIGRAWILFVDTQEAANKLWDDEYNGYFEDEISLEDNVFYRCAPAVYINTLELDKYGYNIWEEYTDFCFNMEDNIRFYEEIKNLVNEKK